MRWGKTAGSTALLCACRSASLKRLRGGIRPIRRFLSTRHHKGCNLHGDGCAGFLTGIRDKLIEHLPKATDAVLVAVAWLINQALFEALVRCQPVG